MTYHLMTPVQTHCALCPIQEADPVPGVGDERALPGGAGDDPPLLAALLATQARQAPHCYR